MFSRYKKQACETGFLTGTQQDPVRRTGTVAGGHTLTGWPGAWLGSFCWHYMTCRGRRWGVQRTLWRSNEPILLQPRVEVKDWKDSTLRGLRDQDDNGVTGNDRKRWTFHFWHVNFWVNPSQVGRGWGPWEMWLGQMAPRLLQGPPNLIPGWHCSPCWMLKRIRALPHPGGLPRARYLF